MKAKGSAFSRRLRAGVTLEALAVGSASAPAFAAVSLMVVAPASLGGTLGAYNLNSSTQLTGCLALNAQGDPREVFTFNNREHADDCPRLDRFADQGRARRAIFFGDTAVSQCRCPMKCDIERAIFRIPRSMAWFDRPLFALLLGVTALVASSFAALSQTLAPSQATPQTLRPAAPSAPSGLPPSPDVWLQVPAGAERLSFMVGRVAIEGAFPELDSETRALVHTVEKHRVSIVQIYEFAGALEQTYARAGYVLVRVMVPPQKLNDGGALRIVVVDGFIEEVQVDNVPDRVRVLVNSRMASLVGRRHIKLNEIERRLLTAGDVPGLRLKSTLARGTTLGGALLVLEGTHRLVSATTNIDNLLPRSLGTWSYGANVALNSPFGYGEQFYASAQSSSDVKGVFDSTSPLRLLGAGAVLPLGLNGWILNPEYTNSRSQPVPTNGGLANIGQFERFALRTSYPLIHTRTTTFSLNGAFEYISQYVTLPLFATDLNRDRYGALRAGAAYETGLPLLGAVLQTSATFSHGIGGRDRADADASGIPLSRQGAGPLFTKGNVDLHLIQPLPEGLRVDLIGRAQTSFGNSLLVSEQFSLDGPQAVSAYPSGTLNVDQGGTLRGELSRPFVVPGFGVPLTLLPYGFGAFGTGRLVEPTIVELAVVRGSALGVGLRSGIDMPSGYQGVTLGLEVARQHSNLPNLAQAWRGNVSMSVRF
jgi:hemolysin activation/secretion protein